jgi:hypothetical protein
MAFNMIKKIVQSYQTRFGAHGGDKVRETTQKLRKLGYKEEEKQAAQ